MKTFVFALIASIILGTSSCVQIQFGQKPPEAGIHHIVLVWLKLSGSPSHRKHIIDGSKALERIPGVISLSAGRSLVSNRNIVDHSFDVGLDITFETRAELEYYLNHPDHVQFVENIKPLVDRIIVYDIKK